MSKKKRQEIAETKAARHANIELGVLCEFCGVAPAVERHEIVGGSYRHSSVYEPHQQMDVCRECHGKYQGSPYALQLAMKFRGAIRAVNRVRGCNFLQEETVTNYMKREDGDD